MKDEKILEKNKGIKTLVRFEAFILILVVFLAYLFTVFELNEAAKNTFETYYSEPKGTVDGVYIGASSTYRYFVPGLCYHDTGAAIFNLATAAQPYTTQKYLIQEARRTQPGIKMVIIELRNVVKGPKQMNAGEIRKVTDSMQFLSPYRIPAINDSLAFYEAMGIDMDYTKKNYYLPFLMYHNRWQEDFKKEEWTELQDIAPYKGFQVDGNTWKTNETPGEYYSTRTEIDELHMKVLDDLLDYCDSIKDEVKIVFVFSPIMTSEERCGRINYTVDHVRDRGYTCWNFNDPQERYLQEVDLDPVEDFYAANHTNMRGAIKYTRYVEKLMVEEFGELPDHRGDAAYDGWQKSYNDLDEKIKAKGEPLQLTGLD